MNVDGTYFNRLAKGKLAGDQGERKRVEREINGKKERESDCVKEREGK